MEYKIALLLKPHYYDYLNDSLKAQLTDIELQFFSYNTLEELNNTFKDIKKDFDAFIVSGIIPKQALLLSGNVDEDTLIEICPIDIENTYRILLKQLIVSEDLKLSRIGMDFLKDEYTLEDLIRKDRFTKQVYDHENRWKEYMSLDGLEREEASICKMYERLYKNGKIDVIITYFYSAIEHMKPYSINCFYVYPSTDMFLRIIEGLKHSIAARTLKNMLSAAIHIDTESFKSLDSASYYQYQQELNSIIATINKANFNKLIFKNNYNDIELYSDYQTLKKMTDNFKACPLWTTLHKALCFNGSIGYGIGNSLYQARINAIDACHYGRNGGAGGGGSFLIDERDTLTVLHTERSQTTYQVSEDYVNTIANEVKLSSETIVRIIGMLHALDTNEITSQELITYLDISLRSANKFLSTLEQHGYAKILTQKRSGNRGRPVNVYQLLLEY